MISGAFPSCRRARPGSQSGALFGLDARLAISIFAMLALIAGYVAFGRVHIAKNAVLIKELESIDEALRAYQADMGTFYLFTLSKQDNESGVRDMEALWDINRVLPGFQRHWNGPYLHRETREHRDFGRFSLLYAQPDRINYCTTDSACYVWIALTNVPEKIWEDINRLLDESGGTYAERAGEEISTGILQGDDITDPRTLFYRSIARP